MTPTPLPRLPEDAIRDIFAREPETLSIDRLSELLDQEPGATYRQLRAGELPFAIRKPNGQWLVYSSAVCSWLVHRLNNPTEGITDADNR